MLLSVYELVNMEKKYLPIFCNKCSPLNHMYYIKCGVNS